MKIEKPKHDHKLTDLLKVGIFSLLMLAPLIASCSQWIYATINKNAYQSYSGTQSYTSATPLYQTNDVNNLDNLIQGNYYELHYTTNFVIEETNSYTETNIKILEDYETDVMNIIKITSNTSSTYHCFTLNNPFIGNIDYLEILTYKNIEYQVSNNELIYNIATYDNFDDTFSGEYMVALINGLNAQYEIETIILFQYLINDYTAFQNSGYSITAVNTMQEYTITQQQSTTLDNAFYYGVDQMTKSDLFNWTQNTALYSGIKAMTDNLQIQTNAIAILLTYWFILTIIYIIVDIVLKLFTTITHLGTKD